MSEEQEHRQIEKGLNIMAETISNNVVRDLKGFIYDDLKDHIDELNPFVSLRNDSKKLKFSVMVGDFFDYYSLDELIFDEIKSTYDGRNYEEIAGKIIDHLKNIINKLEQEKFLPERNKNVSS